MANSFGDRSVASRLQFDPGTTAGHYEVYFAQANHPERPLAFWIRYTVFCPKGHSEHTVGELSVSYFDGENNRVVRVKEALPDEQCGFSPTEMRVRIGASTLTTSKLGGAANSDGHMMIWALKYRAPNAPLLLMPEGAYNSGGGKIKMITPSPGAIFDGLLQVDGEPVLIEGWNGCIGHHWGREYPDRLLWGQVVGFDSIAQATLECAMMQSKAGPLWMPAATMMVLRLGMQDLSLNSNGQALMARSSLKGLRWGFSSAGRELSVKGFFETVPNACTILKVMEPAGNSKLCFCTAIARCEVVIEQKGKPALTLISKNRASFEIVGDWSVGAGIARGADK